MAGLEARGRVSKRVRVPLLLEAVAEHVMEASERAAVENVAAKMRDGVTATSMLQWKRCIGSWEKPPGRRIDPDGPSGCRAVFRPLVSEMR